MSVGSILGGAAKAFGGAAMGQLGSIVVSLAVPVLIPKIKAFIEIQKEKNRRPEADPDLC